MDISKKHFFFAVFQKILNSFKLTEHFPQTFCEIFWHYLFKNIVELVLTSKATFYRTTAYESVLRDQGW